ncbi:hypothetical protein NX059_012282 [Plenodomus lindquistii]|nr:hypothetical protein NX059_012282 [Plenodomus lindquistii]
MLSKIPKTQAQLKAILELEDVADGLDAVIWKSKLRINELMQIRERIASAFTHRSCGTAIQFTDKHYCHDTSEIRLTLPKRATKLATIAVGKSTLPTEHFAKFFRYLGLTRTAANAVVLQSRFHTVVLGRLYDRDAALSRLFYVIRNQLIETQANTGTRAYQLILSKGLEDLHSLEPKTIHAAAWNKLSLVGLQLCVLNYPHDPALRPMIERKIFNEQKAGMISALTALQRFQLDFTAEDTTFRTRQE